MGKSSGGGGGTPSPSEYMPLIEQQARLNRVNQYNPLYQTTYRQIGEGTPSVTRVSSSTGFDANAYTPIKGSRNRTIGYIGPGGNSLTTDEYNRLVTQGIPASASGYASPFSGGGGGATGQWEQVTQLSPAGQQLFQQQLAAALNPDQYNQTVSNATFQHAMNLLNPQYQQQQRQFEQQMANRGLVSGGEAYDTGYQNMMQAQNQARENAALASVLQGQNAAQQAYSRLAGLTGMGLSGGGNVPGIDVMSPYQIAQQARKDDAAQAAQQKQSNTQGAAALGTMAMMMCDKNIKTDKAPIDYHDILDGFEKVNIERWKYIGENREHIGPYAQEFKEAFGVGSGMDISPIDAIGVLMAANKALIDRVKALETRHG